MCYYFWILSVGVNALETNTPETSLPEPPGFSENWLNDVVIGRSMFNPEEISWAQLYAITNGLLERVNLLRNKVSHLVFSELGIFSELRTSPLLGEDYGLLLDLLEGLDPFHELFTDVSSRVLVKRITGPIEEAVLDLTILKYSALHNVIAPFLPLIKGRFPELHGVTLEYLFATRAVLVSICGKSQEIVPNLKPVLSDVWVYMNVESHADLPDRFVEPPGTYAYQKAMEILHDVFKTPLTQYRNPFYHQKISEQEWVHMFFFGRHARIIARQSLHQVVASYLKYGPSVPDTVIQEKLEDYLSELKSMRRPRAFVNDLLNQQAFADVQQWAFDEWASCSNTYWPQILAYISSLRKEVNDLLDAAIRRKVMQTPASPEDLVDLTLLMGYEELIDHYRDVVPNALRRLVLLRRTESLDQSQEKEALWEVTTIFYYIWKRLADCTAILQAKGYTELATRGLVYIFEIQKVLVMVGMRTAWWETDDIDFNDFWPRVRLMTATGLGNELFEDTDRDKVLLDYIVNLEFPIGPEETLITKKKLNDFFSARDRKFQFKLQLYLEVEKNMLDEERRLAFLGDYTRARKNLNEARETMNTHFTMQSIPAKLSDSGFCDAFNGLST